MTVNELKARLKSGELASFYIIAGEEEYLKKHYRNEIKKAICPDENDPFAFFNHVSFDGEDFDIGAFSEAVKAPPMMSELKLIEWRFADLGKLKEREISALCDLASMREAHPYAVAVITTLPDGFDTGTPKRPSKLYARLSECFDIISFEKSTDSQLQSWISRHFAAEGLRVDPRTVGAMLERVGHSMHALACEIEKLACYAKSHGIDTVTVSEVTDICSSTIECDAFAISNAIIEKNTEKAFLALSDMKQQRIEPGAAIAQLARTYADLTSIAYLTEEGLGAADIASIMKFHPYKLGLYMTAAKKLGAKKIAASLASLVKTDAESKAGGISGYEAVEIFIAKNIGR